MDSLFLPPGHVDMKSKENVDPATWSLLLRPSDWPTSPDAHIPASTLFRLRTCIVVSPFHAQRLTLWKQTIFTAESISGHLSELSMLEFRSVSMIQKKKKETTFLPFHTVGFCSLALTSKWMRPRFLLMNHWWNISIDTTGAERVIFLHNPTQRNGQYISCASYWRKGPWFVISNLVSRVSAVHHYHAVYT